MDGEKMPDVKSLMVPLLILLIFFAYYITPSGVQQKPVIHLNLSPISDCSGNVCVEVNPYLELTDVVFHMAGWNYNDTPYAREAMSYFSPYKNHKAVLLARKAMKKGLKYDAIPRFAMQLNSTEWDEHLIGRVHGDEKLLNELALAMKEFARDSNFSGFYEGHGKFYEGQINLSLKENPNLFSIPNFEENFFGGRKERYVFVLQPLEMYSSYGGYMDGGTVYGFLGVCSNGSYCDASVHELAHSFVNPAVDAHYAEFKEYSQMFSPVKEVMPSMAYSTWKVYLDETFIRAFNAYYILETEGNQSAERFIEGQESLGFYLVGKVYRAYLTDYLPNRDKYPTFGSFMPELARLMGKWYRDGFWKNVSPEPTIERAFLEFKHKGVKVYVVGNLSESTYVKNYVEMLKEAGFNARLTDRLDGGNLIVIAPLDSPITRNLNKYVELKNCSVVVDGTAYSSGVFLVEALKNPNGDGFLLLIAGTPDVFGRKPSNGDESLGDYHYFVYLTSIKRIVAFG